MAKMGRARIEIDFNQLDRLCFIQCSESEIATFFNCSVDTIERRVKEKTGVTFAEYFEKKRIGGLISLRRSLFQLSEKNAAVAIFLAKNWLGMADTHEIESKQPLVDARRQTLVGVSVGDKDDIKELLTILKQIEQFGSARDIIEGRHYDDAGGVDAERS